ncbi:hypothetical protein R3P38DRAFT_2982060 [Favolaschia claudopus]|uniref:Uncharacterized protein n=1 Tax=Favolaschia claudopus TaxID=2862362 RepID=A0AAW0AY83_9AGAR
MSPANHTLPYLLNLILTSISSSSFTPTPFDPGFNITAVAEQAQSLPSHSWEFGTAVQAYLELNSPLLSVFAPTPFPVSNPSSHVPALVYAEQKIILGSGANGLADGDGATGDPASLGVGAVLLGKTDARFASAAASEIDYLMNKAPRWANGAISQRADVPNIWADFMFMAPPFIAFYAADSNDLSLLHEAYSQCGFYREILLFNSNSTSFSPIGTSPTNGLWRHIVGPQGADPGTWSTGNGWAAMGMARVLATLLKAPVSQDKGASCEWCSAAIKDLSSWIKEILDGARASQLDQGLLRNYLDNVSGDGHGFGEISGSAMLAAVAYRMVVHASDMFDETYIAWADGIREVLAGEDSAGNPHVSRDGIVTPAVNPLGWWDTTPWTSGSPEGNNFAVLLYSAWRDCVYASLCKKPPAFKTSGARRSFSVPTPTYLIFGWDVRFTLALFCLLRGLDYCYESW